jgi:hypothetical protein
MARLVFSELLQMTDGPVPETIELGFRGNDGRTYSANISRKILPALTLALTARCRRSLEEYQSSQSVDQQPVPVIAGRTMITADNSGAVSLLTAFGVEILLVFQEAEFLTRLRTEIAKLEAALSKTSHTAH